MSGLTHVRILHDNASSHTSKIVKQFLSRGGYHPVTPIILTRSSDFSLFQDLKSYLVVFINPNKPMASPSVSVLEVYFNQHNVTHFKNGFKDWKYVFQTAENNRSSVMFISLFESFKIPYNAHYVSNNHRFFSNTSSRFVKFMPTRLEIQIL